MCQEKKKVHAFKSLCPHTCINVPQCQLMKVVFAYFADQKGINMLVKFQLFSFFPCKQVQIVDTYHFSDEFSTLDWVSEAAESGVVLDSSISIFGAEILLFIRTTTIVMEDMQKMTMIQEIPIIHFF